MSLTITLGSISLEVGTITTPFQSSQFPRLRPESPTIEYSANGTPASTGVNYEKHFWRVDVGLAPAQQETLQDIYALWRSDPSTNLTVIDTTKRYREPTPRTRAIAPGATEDVSDGLTRYFAQFYAGFEAEPTFEQDGAIARASFVLKEAERYDA
jgi:hypothetical protein